MKLGRTRGAHGDPPAGTPARRGALSDTGTRANRGTDLDPPAADGMPRTLGFVYTLHGGPDAPRTRGRAGARAPRPRRRPGRAVPGRRRRPRGPPPGRAERPVPGHRVGPEGHPGDRRSRRVERVG